MKTAVIGFPRIGKDRELKFASEKYFKGEISEEELKKVASDIRKENLLEQSKQGITYIPVNDFSFYDNVLDTAVLFNVIPKRYKELGLSELDTYFAMARGYQKDKGNVKALAMKKWFNTNYHYIVPEFEDDTKIKLNDEFVIDRYKEAVELDIDAKVNLIGPFTFLKLTKFVGSKTIDDVKEKLVLEYVKLLNDIKAAGGKTVSIDEPYLVRDLDSKDKELFNYLYDIILNSNSGVKVILQTYFGDVRDIYEELIKLPFAGIGIDFVEGKESLNLVKKYGFPSDKILFAGLVNGKNIWRNNYRKTIDTFEVIKKALKSEENIVISTSCSLLHVPYTTESETKLQKDYIEHFAFAKEKLVELKEIAALVKLDDFAQKGSKCYKDNQNLHASRINSFDKKVKDRVSKIKKSDYERLPKFEEREKIQKEKLDLPLFPTTTIGSFPQTAEVRKNRRDFKNGIISKEQYIKFNKEKIAKCIALQEEIGLDVLVHGEYERNDMVEYFGEHLSGYVFTEKAWVQSYGTRCVKPPIIWGDVSRKESITVEWSKFAKQCTTKKVKGMLTGPVTILNWSFPREDITIKESVLQIALAIRDEVLDLEANGIDIIQIDEAALREKLPLRKSDWYSEYLDFAIPAFRLVHSGVKPETQIHTHMCYSEFTDIIPAIDAMDADVITFEASRSDLQILDSLKENNFKTEVGPGVYDIHSPRVPSVEEIVNALNLMREKLDDNKLWVNPDCGLKTRGDKETKESLINLVLAAKQVRAEDEQKAV
ncbi:5-methyltetrahydropteroyltriglutamate--homocysteine S-methyltransferase [Eubacterium sp.]|uniref:5-methyltetrahydropteroyltriglutamate-- homocysteine S-methyltransferase n=1 Tax=Eubacterium sp. TaxID=142586 RepID=UPI0025D76876|nr:5-methyltetrahydropteroyltriglutamate--homocysteine S-methyltransferase [Eubacterium sp.]MCR5629037.1 5-methyltetrahydropteroyltriglutamate--homocysteine S-methyltransferase [Eubacterium sp.]